MLEFLHVAFNLVQGRCAAFYCWFMFSYAGCPQGRPCLKLGLVSSSYFFSSLKLQICTLIYSLNSALSLERIYCSDCLQQNWPNQNLLLVHISRGRGPPHLYLCDVKIIIDLFIKPGLNSALSLWRPYCLQVLDSTMPFSKRKLTLLKR